MTFPRLPKASVSPFVETHCEGTDSFIQRIRAAECALLERHRILHAGIADAAAPFCMIRTNLPGAFFLASCGGEGEVFLDGRWQRSPSGTASLFPPHVLHGIRCRPTVRWRFAWIRYDAEATPGLLTHLHTPVSASFSGEALYASLLALHHEAHGSADPSALHHLVELVHRYALRFAQPWQGLPQ